VLVKSVTLDVSISGKLVNPVQLAQVLYRLTTVDVSITGKSVNPLQYAQVLFKVVEPDTDIIGNVVRPVQLAQALSKLATEENTVGPYTTNSVSRYRDSKVLSNDVRFSLTISIFVTHWLA
jgi:hypothetical protein